ncbi:MAG: ABC transporter substrate-binding protein [Candidatus Thorarchaeota archaeon]
MRTRWIAISLVIGIISSLLLVYPASSQEYNFYESGPHIDKVVYIVIPDRTERLNGLLSSRVDMVMPFLNTSEMYSQALEWGMEADIELSDFLRNGYGQITFNCREYPLNISGFRRAFAYAFDKMLVVDELHNWAQEHDSLVPAVNPFCIEDGLDWHWYSKDSDTGNAILDDLNFTVDPVTGFRVAPNGERFGVHIKTFNPINNDEIAQITKEAFEALNIAVVVNDPSVYFLPEVHLHERDFDDFDITWMVSEYGSEYTNNTMINLSGFSNSTFDFWGRQLLTSSSYEDVFHAASEMQKILHNEVPSLIAYQNIYHQAYSSYRFMDYVEDIDRYMTGLWTTMNVKRVDGYGGGVLAIGVETNPDSLNPFTGQSEVSKAIFDGMLLGLYARTPTLEPTPQIAKAMTVERHQNNTQIPKGNTRFTFDVNTNLRWTDGVNITAYDVAFTFNYIKESGMYGNPMAEKLTDLFTVYAPSPYQVVFEFSSESYWNFEKIAYTYILPKHVIEKYGYDEWYSWNLVSGELPDIQSISSGPFMLVDYKENDFYELSINPDWYKYEVVNRAISDVYIIPAQDFSTMLPFFQLKWDLEFVPEPEYSDQYPFGMTYSILLDGEHFHSGQWTFDYYYFDETIYVNVNDPYLTQGTHNFTIVIESPYHGLEKDTVIVTVQVSMYQVTPIFGFMIPFLVTGMIVIIRQIIEPKPIIEREPGVQVVTR